MFLVRKYQGVNTKIRVLCYTKTLKIEEEIAMKTVWTAVPSRAKKPRKIIGNNVYVI